jgi:hypothetical protein
VLCVLWMLAPIAIRSMEASDGRAACMQRLLLAAAGTAKAPD